MHGPGRARRGATALPTRARCSSRRGRRATCSAPPRWTGPEWIAVDAQGWVYCTLTNNSNRGEPKPGRPSTRPIRAPTTPWATSSAGRRTATSTARASDGTTSCSQATPPTSGPMPRATSRAMPSAAPTGCGSDGRGVLWIQTDMSTSAMGKGDLARLGNNCMLAADPRSGEIRRFLVGPAGCEVTGAAGTPDGRTMFVNIQHPGESPSERSDPDQPRRILELARPEPVGPAALGDGGDPQERRWSRGQLKPTAPPTPGGAGVGLAIKSARDRRRWWRTGRRAAAARSPAPRRSAASLHGHTGVRPRRWRCPAPAASCRSRGQGRPGCLAREPRPGPASDASRVARRSGGRRKTSRQDDVLRHGRPGALLQASPAASWQAVVRDDLRLAANILGRRRCHCARRLSPRPMAGRHRRATACGRKRPNPTAVPRGQLHKLYLCRKAHASAYRAALKTAFRRNYDSKTYSSERTERRLRPRRTGQAGRRSRPPWQPSHPPMMDRPSGLVPCLEESLPSR